MPVDEGQLIRVVSTHSRKLERLETLPVPSGSRVHHTLCVFVPVVTGAFTIGRLRLLPGTGLQYRPISWSLNADIDGNVLVDILGGVGYPPPTSVCWANKPRLLGQKAATGLCSGWNVTLFPHGYYLIVNIESYSILSQVALSLELAPETI
jgi:hypothetical protein